MRPRIAICATVVSIAISMASGLRPAHSLARNRSFIMGSSSSSAGSSSALPGRSSGSTKAARAKCCSTQA